MAGGWEEPPTVIQVVVTGKMKSPVPSPTKAIHSNTPLRPPHVSLSPHCCSGAKHRAKYPFISMRPETITPLEELGRGAAVITYPAPPHRAHSRFWECLWDSEHLIPARMYAIYERPPHPTKPSEMTVAHIRSILRRQVNAGEKRPGRKSGLSSEV